MSRCLLDAEILLKQLMILAILTLSLIGELKMAKMNIFSRFSYGMKLKSYVTPALRKRDVHVTLGGHSLSYLLKEIQKDTNDEHA